MYQHVGINLNMKKLLLFLAFMVTTNGFAQIVEYADKEFVDCATASSILELSNCSAYKLEQAEKQLALTYREVLNKLETLVIEDDNLKKDLKKEDPSFDSSSLTDYRKIKKWVVKSQNLFNNYADLETGITGELVGIGRERSIHENNRKLQLIEQRIKDLKAVIE
jgi:hypothetical protein